MEDIKSSMHGQGFFTWLPLLFRKKHLFSTEYLPHVELGLENAAAYF